MSTTLPLSVNDARKLALSAQGLLRRNPFGRGKNGAANAINQLGYVQIDTISVVNRAHEHVMQVRVPGFQADRWNQLLADKTVFEYWFHAAAYLPLSEYRFYRRAMAAMRERVKLRVQPDVHREVLARIRAEGPQGSRDFSGQGHNSSGWWDWKPAKVALEQMYMQGDLTVVARQGFQKIYDLTERVIPGAAAANEPGESEWARFLVARVIRSQGVAALRDITHLRQGARPLYPVDIVPPVKRAIDELVEAGEIVEVSVADAPYYTSPTALESLPLKTSRQAVRFLSPFDNTIINRRRARLLFDFDYTLECYVPELKRKFGYFCLPMLLGTRFIGRMDAKANRRTGTLEIRHLALEPEVQAATVVEAIRQGLADLASDLNCSTLHLDRVPAPLRKLQLEL